MPDISDKDVLEELESAIRFKSLLPARKSNEHFSPEVVRKDPIIAIDPKRCKLWQYHNRDEAWLTAENCQDLIKSIQKHGQLEPALVREVKGDPHYEFEVIYGVRRWFACSQIPNQSFLARITEADDKTCMVLMHTENADSKDITEFERAFSFARQIKSGLFKNQTEMAEMMGLTQGYISKLIKTGEIFEYEWIKKLFQNKLDISVKYAYELSVLLKKPAAYERIRQEAEAIRLEKETTGILPTASQVLKRLISVNKPHTHQPLKAIMFQFRNKPIVSCSLDKFGKLSLFIESEAKALNPAEIEQACLKAIRDYVFP